ncbi:hypothetical protein Syun_023670 [Stephania yunnanensis]|uniref:Pentatricopeptide repeat-containing protein n=1 Tax=Stephania yunnanensis TaxID=152371 RepID=A0AAP0FA24_9MAGN
MQGLSLFKILRYEGILTDQFSFVCVLKSCARGLALNFGQSIHGLVIVCGMELFINLRNTLLRVYGFCGRIGDAHQVFDEIPERRDLVSWNILIGCYLHGGQPYVVVDLFKQMRVNGFELNAVTIISVASAAYSDLESVCGGESLHGYCVKSGFCSELIVVSTIVRIYGRNGRMDYGRKVFDEMPKRDLVLWNCVIDGYAKNGLLYESLSLLQQMKFEQVKPNSATLAGLLSGCASAGALVIGKCIHEYIEEEESLELDAVLGTALMDMYSKCGLLEKAVEVFDKMQNKDVKSWTAMISAYGFHGRAFEAIRLLNSMEDAGVAPNEVTLLAVVTACSHGGLVMEGKNCFERMVRDHGLLPNTEHYGCMIDLLGRAGLLDDAYELIKSLPVEKDATAWRALLAACRVHGNVELSRIVEKALLDLGVEHPTDSILVSSAYAVAERWDDVARMRGLEEEKKMKKKVGSSSIELDAAPLEKLSSESYNGDS